MLSAKLITFTTITTLTLGHVYYHRRHYMSVVLHKTMRSPPVTNSLMRTTFMDCSFPERRAVENHSHGTSAAGRSDGVYACTRTAQLVGRTPYFAQCSPSDQRSGRSGSREYYWAKDLSTQPEKFNPPVDALLVLVDVDYYMDMNAFLASNVCPVLLYTFCPDDVAGSYSDYCFTIGSDSQVKMHVTGGSYYEHKIWNYGSDTVLAMDRVFGLPIKATLYNIDRRQLEKNRYLVLLTPIGSWTWSSPFLLCLSYNILGRYQYVFGAHTRLDILQKGEHLRATGRVDSYNSVVIPASVDDGIAALSRANVTPIGIPTIQSMLQKDDDRSSAEDRLRATALVEYHRTKNFHRSDFVFPVAHSVRTYVPFTPEYNGDEKPSMVPYMSPLIHGCFAPAQCLASDTFAVTERILKIATDVKPNILSMNLDDEFLMCLFPEPGILIPVELDEVYERQDKPTQRRLLDDACVTGEPNRLVHSFCKREAYGDLKPPRVISTINPVDKMEYAQFIYALMDHIAKAPWYAAKKPPAEIADNVVTIAEFAQFIVETDFQKMDGRIAETCREFEKKALLRGFSSKYHNKLLELHRNHYCLHAVTKFGFWYETLFARNSGELATSAFNTMISARAAFGGFRLSTYKGRACTPREAYDRLGIYQGDDGITADINPQAYMHSAALMGQVMIAKVHKRGSLGVKFLSRYYGPDVWTGDNNSCCDLPRALSKFHTTVCINAKVTPIDKLVEKCRAYWLTDSNTPVIGQLVTNVMRRCFEILKEPLLPNPLLADDVSWTSYHPKELQYPNVDSGWMEDYAHMSMPEFDFELFAAHMAMKKDLSDYLCLPLFMQVKEPTPTVIPIVVDDMVIPAKVPDTIVIVKCLDCPSDAFDLKEASHVLGKGFKLPTRCKPCREKRKLKRGLFIGPTCELFDGLIMPIAEEVFKHLSWLSVPFVALETWSSFMIDPMSALPTLGMHLLCYALPVLPAIAVHTFWNAVIVPVTNLYGMPFAPRVKDRPDLMTVEILIDLDSLDDNISFEPFMGQTCPVQLTAYTPLSNILCPNVDQPEKPLHDQLSLKSEMQYDQNKANCVEQSQENNLVIQEEEQSSAMQTLPRSQAVNLSGTRILVQFSKISETLLEKVWEQFGTGLLDPEHIPSIATVWQMANSRSFSPVWEWTELWSLPIQNFLLTYRPLVTHSLTTPHLITRSILDFSRPFRFCPGSLAILRSTTCWDVYSCLKAHLAHPLEALTLLLVLLPVPRAMTF